MIESHSAAAKSSTNRFTGTICASMYLYGGSHLKVTCASTTLTTTHW